MLKSAIIAHSLQFCSKNSRKMGVGKVQCLVSDLRIFFIISYPHGRKKAYALNHISFLKGSGIACEQLNVKNGHTLCWKHSIIFTSSLFY